MAPSSISQGRTACLWKAARPRLPRPSVPAKSRHLPQQPGPRAGQQQGGRQSAVEEQLARSIRQGRPAKAKARHCRPETQGQKRADSRLRAEDRRARRPRTPEGARKKAAARAAKPKAASTRHGQRCGCEVHSAVVPESRSRRRRASPRLRRRKPAAAGNKSSISRAGPAMRRRATRRSVARRTRAAASAAFDRRPARRRLPPIRRTARLHLHGQVAQLRRARAHGDGPRRAGCSRAGLAKGARVAIMMPNALQYPVAIMAVLRAGYVGGERQPALHAARASSTSSTTAVPRPSSSSKTSPPRCRPSLAKDPRQARRRRLARRDARAQGPAGQSSSVRQVKKLVPAWSICPATSRFHGGR